MMLGRADRADPAEDTSMFFSKQTRVNLLAVGILAATGAVPCLGVPYTWDFRSGPPPSATGQTLHESAGLPASDSIAGGSLGATVAGGAPAVGWPSRKPSNVGFDPGFLDPSLGVVAGGAADAGTMEARGGPLRLFALPLPKPPTISSRYHRGPITAASTNNPG